MRARLLHVSAILLRSIAAGDLFVMHILVNDKRRCRKVRSMLSITPT